jgi:hypothetical protein
MRSRIFWGLSGFALLAFLLIGLPGYGQFKGGGPPGFGPGGSSIDPNKVFDWLSKGRGYILVDEMRKGRSLMMDWAKEKGITFVNGQMTREQYLAYSEYKAQMPAAANMAVRTIMLPPGPGAPGSPAGGGISNDMLNQAADAEFRRRDANGDGKLNLDEMPGPLRQDLARWDTNRDGLIDQAEYRNYYITRMMERISGQGGPGGGGGFQFQLTNPSAMPPPEDELDKRPVVYRAGKLPERGLPPWFKQLDYDEDGQIALWEWRKAGKEISEFKLWDRNDDGFITPEEALVVQADLVKSNPQLAGGPPSSQPGATVVMSPVRPPSFNGGGPPDRKGPPRDKKDWDKKDWKGKKKGGGGGGEN